MTIAAASTNPLRALGLAPLLALLAGTPLSAQVSPGDIASVVEIAAGSGGFGGLIEADDLFGAALAPLGDLDGDGTADLAFGAPGDDDGGPQYGAVWILFMADDGTVASWQKISATSGGFGGALGNNVGFGHALAAAGDIDGDGVGDLVVGAPRDGDGGPKHGAAWVLLLNTDGTVKAEQKISQTVGGFVGPLANSDEFGRAVSAAGDVDGDGVPDIAVSALNDDDVKPQSGAVYVLLLEADGSVKSELKISGSTGGFGGALDSNDEFGRSITSLGDLDGNGVPDLAVGALGDDDGGLDAGAAWVLFLASDGTVLDQQKLSSTTGGLPALDAGDGFGRGLAAVGDVDGDGVVDALVGAPGDDDGGLDRGAAWLLFLAADGSVVSTRKYASTPGGPFEALADGAGFGTAVAAARDVDKNGAGDLLVGSDSEFADLLLLEALDSVTPYVPSAAVFDGKPGRSVLVPQEANDSGYEDFIDEPVVVVTNTTGDSVNLRVGGATGGAGGEGENYVFSESGEFPTGEDPLDVIPGDFFDGSAFGGLGQLADLVVANYGSDSISLLEALPGGTYAPHVEFSMLPQNGAPVALEAADFDGDGQLDVAVAGSDGVTVFLGDGLGDFPTTTFTPLPLLTDLAVGFVDGDALPDLVTTSGRAVTVAQPGEEGFATVLLGNGDGSFSDAGSFAGGQALASVLMADVDQDTMQDVLLVTHALADGAGGVPQGRIELFVGDGLGAFTPSAAFAGVAIDDPQGIHPTLGALGDLDGDGWLDAVYSSNDSIAYAAGTFADEQPPVVLTVLRGDQAGGFVASEVGTAYAGKGVAPILADIFPDADGDPDAILVWYEDAAAGLGDGVDDALTTFLSAFTADGEAGFFDPASNQYATGAGPANARVIDIDTGGAGRLDIAVPDLADGSLTVMLGDGEGGIRSTFTLPGLGPYTVGDLPPGDWVGGPREVEVTDTNGDGFGDVIVYAAWEDRSGASAEAFASLTLVDYASATVTQTLPLPRGGELGLADVTGDGLGDALVTQRLGPAAFEGLAMHAGLPDGDLDPAPLLAAVPAGWLLSGGLASGDVTGDGLADAITTAVDPQSGLAQLIVVELQGGVPALQTSALGPAWDSVRSVALGDLDGDGATDVAVGLDDGRLRLARGLGGGAFAPAPLDALPASVGGGAIALGDVNGDGRLDIVSSTAVDDGLVDQAFVRVLLSQGGGAYQLENVDALQSTGAIGALRPLLADMNRDGAPDLVLSHGTSDAVSILLNQLNAFSSYGSGKAGSGGIVPALSGTGFTTPGGAFTLHVDDVLGGATGLLFLGFGEVEAPPLHVATALIQLPLLFDGEAGVAGAGSVELPLLLPPDPEFVGITLSSQALVLDPGAGPPAPVWLATSNGLSLTIVQ